MLSSNFLELETQTIMDTYYETRIHDGHILGGRITYEKGWFLNLIAMIISTINRNWIASMEGH